MEFIVCVVYVPDTKDIKMVCPQRPYSLIGIATVCPAMMCVSLIWINSWLVNRAVMTTWWTNSVGSCNSNQNQVLNPGWRQQTTYQCPSLPMPFLLTWFGYVLCVRKYLFCDDSPIWGILLLPLCLTAQLFLLSSFSHLSSRNHFFKDKSYYSIFKLC